MDHLAGEEIQDDFAIGNHVARRGSVANTIRTLPIDRPYQIFLGNPRGLHASNISDSDLQAAAAEVGERRIYVHAAYTINLCRPEPPSLLVRTLEQAVAIGARGVVVHVGKSLGHPPADALTIMRTNILIAAAAATADCPLLLETPAGQGTETLTDADEFFSFTSGIAADCHSPNVFGTCVDTCHVFAAGHDPVDYTRRAIASGLLRLVHFNDSAAICGARVDRHAFIGTGHVGAAPLREVATACQAARIDMVVE
jgi:deoxyribonuclease-4